MNRPWTRPSRAIDCTVTWDEIVAEAWRLGEILPLPDTSRAQSIEADLRRRHMTRIGGAA